MAPRRINRPVAASETRDALRISAPPSRPNQAFPAWRKLRCVSQRFRCPAARYPAFLLLLALPLSHHLSAAPSKTVTIDNLCRDIRKEFVEAEPHYFAGPDPWTQLDKPPDSDADGVIATVYQEGARIRWVVLEMADPDNAWSQTTHYFFDENGFIQKRERRLSDYNSHIQVNEDRYFVNGKEMKTNYRSAPLPDEGSSAPQKENWETFSDPEAPLYISTADLPEVFLTAAFEKLADLAVKIFPSLLMTRSFETGPPAVAEGSRR